MPTADVPPLEPLDPLKMIRPRRKITGMSAILLPFAADGAVDWTAFDAHLARTAAAGLTPAVNMDTGYANLLTPTETLAVLDRTRGVLGGGAFVAGAFVGDVPGAKFDAAAYLARMEPIVARGGTPVIFQSYGLTELPEDEIPAAYATLIAGCDRFIGFELGTMFAPFGRIYTLETYRALMEIPQCVGAKHSSLDRGLEWERLRLRDAVRPDFKVLTGNDLAIDMVMYGSDYLLGISTFAPDLFAKRDALWEIGDPAFHQLNDALQYLGFFAFRPPVPAYKHDAAMFLKLRGWISTDRTHPKSPERPAADLPVLTEIAKLLEVAIAG